MTEMFWLVIDALEVEILTAYIRANRTSPSVHAKSSVQDRSKYRERLSSVGCMDQ